MLDFPKKSMRKVCLDTMESLGRQFPDFITMGADGRSIFERFAKSFSNRYVDVGISEQNLIGVATGLARSGRVVFVSAIASFLLRRAYEQIRIDICNANLPVKMVGVGGGVSYGALGSTHHMIEDIALVRSLPNMAVFIPSDAHDAVEALKASFAWKGPAYIRLGTGDEPYLHNNSSSFQIGKPEVLCDGNDFIIFATGICVSEALKASLHLKAEGYDVGVINVHTMKPFHEKKIIELTEGKKAVLVVEEHSIMGGLGSIIAEVISKHLFCPLERMGIDDRPALIGNREDLLDYYQLTYKHIIKRIKQLAGGL